jgi:GYF domain 2
MDAIYLVRDGQQAGPFTRAQIDEMLAKGQITPDTMAWYEGVANWAALGTLLGPQAVSGAVPPAPAPIAPAAQTFGTGFSKDDLRRICKAQNLLMWAVLANIVATILVKVLLLIGILIALGVVVFMLYALCQLTSALRYPTWATVLLCVTMFIPCVSLIVLVLVSGQASKFLKAAGVRVGLMGGKIEDIRD